MKTLFYSLFLLFAPLAAKELIQLKSKVDTGTPGDYIVLQQGSHQSLLLLRSLAGSHATFEEIAIPAGENKLAWDEWVKKKAPGHTSWIAYEIDLKNNTLCECYSYSRQGWLALSDHFFTELLSLFFEKGHDEQRKKIGPAPLDGEVDRREFWVPPKIFQGKKSKSPRYEFLLGKWPQDGSELSGCTIETYFDSDNPTFPFPYWIDIRSPHYTMRISIIDSGRGLSSPQSELPKRQKPIQSEL